LKERNHQVLNKIAENGILVQVSSGRNMRTERQNSRDVVPSPFRPQLLSVAKRVFWWGQPEDWLEDPIRFVAQVMTYGDWDDVRTTLSVLGEKAFLRVLENPPPGVFDVKSWTFWHTYYYQAVPAMPVRKL